MAYTTVTAAAVGARIKAVWANLLVSAIQELQAAAVGLGTDKRPQLRVYAPATVTAGSAVPYATVLKDTHSGWNSTTRKYTVPVAGLYLCSIQWKFGGVASTQVLTDNASGAAIFTGPNSGTAAYGGFSASGTVDLTAGQVVYIKETAATASPHNDTTGAGGTGSNYFHLTYLGPTT